MNSGFATYWILYIAAVVCVFDGWFLGWLANLSPNEDPSLRLAQDPTANPGKKPEREGAGVLRWIARAQYLIALGCLIVGIYFHLTA